MRSASFVGGVFLRDPQRESVLHNGVLLLGGSDSCCVRVVCIYMAYGTSLSCSAADIDRLRSGGILEWSKQSLKGNGGAVLADNNSIWYTFGLWRS